MDNDGHVKFMQTNIKANPVLVRVTKPDSNSFSPDFKGRNPEDLVKEINDKYKINLKYLGGFDFMVPENQLETL